MSAWEPRHYRRHGQKSGVDDTILRHASASAQLVQAVHPKLPPVLTLKHLALLTGVDYGFLRAIVTRDFAEPYRTFRIRKHPKSGEAQKFRLIAVPHPDLLTVQRWIAQRILAYAKAHSTSVAYSKGNTIVKAANPHCECRWLIKLDVKRFFESISEISVYRVFRSLGYQPLVAFELSRISTRLGRSTLWQQAARWSSVPRKRIVPYQMYRMGHLPQGAPTSPMLANLAMLAFDQVINTLAEAHDLSYTRYADDIALSSQDKDFSRTRCRHVIGHVYAELGRHGLSPNLTKTRIRSPGSRKIVLGLLVDRDLPRLTRDFKQRMRQHLHYLSLDHIGPVEHARARGFTSTVGMKNYLYGLASFAAQVEPDYAAQCKKSLDKISWPL